MFDKRVDDCGTRNEEGRYNVLGKRLWKFYARGINSRSRYHYDEMKTMKTGNSSFSFLAFNFLLLTRPRSILKNNIRLFVVSSRVLFSQSHQIRSDPRFSMKDWSDYFHISRWRSQAFKINPKSILCICPSCGEQWYQNIAQSMISPQNGAASVRNGFHQGLISDPPLKS